MRTPFDTGKIKIGCNYQHPVQPWFPSRAENMLQESMLQANKDKQSKQAKPDRQTDWDGIGIVAGCIAAVILAYGLGWLSI